MICRAPSFMPDIFSTRHVFCRKISIIFVGDTNILYPIIGNSVHDCLQAGGMTPPRPLGYDEMAVIYKRYRVTGCAITYDIIHDLTTSYLDYFIIPSGTAPLASLVADDAQENSRSHSKFVAAIGAGQNPRTFRMKCFYKPSTIFSRDLMRTGGFDASIDTDPALKMYITLGVTAPVATTHVITVNIRVVFYTTWYKTHIIQG